MLKNYLYDFVMRDVENFTLRNWDECEIIVQYE